MSRAHLAAAVTGIFLAPLCAYGQEVWNFNGPQQALPTSETVFSTPDHVGDTISGFNTSGVAENLFEKNAGGLEVGLGEMDDPSGLDEITSGNFIQISLANLTAAQDLAVSFGASSDTVDFNGNPERWGLALSNTSGVEGAIVETGDSDFPTVADINTTGFKFLDVTDVTSGPGNGILLRELDAPLAAVPEPTSLASMGGALLSLAAIGWLRRRRS